MSKVYNLIILDESGSMAAIQNLIVSSFNELIQNIASQAIANPLQHHFINFFSFNGNGIKEQIPLQPVTTITRLNERNYQPDSLTPLFDAIGHATAKLRFALEKETNYKVLVTILTDGAENASKEFTASTISNIISELQKHNWLFTYMGTDHDVARIAERISIFNYMSFKNDAESFSNAMETDRNARIQFYLSEDEDVGTLKNYFMPTENRKDEKSE